MSNNTRQILFRVSPRTKRALITRIVYVIAALGLAIGFIEGHSISNSGRATGLLAANEGFVIYEGAEVAVRSIYSNYDYAFSVRIPKGTVGYRSAAPNPNHGFVIRRSTGNNEISVFASYNGSEWRSFDDVVKARMQSFRDETGGECTLLKRTPTIMGGLKALKFVIRSTQSDASKTMVCETVVAFRTVPGEIGIVYEISLTTPESAFPQSARLVRSLQQSFRQRALPKNDLVRHSSKIRLRACVRELELFPISFEPQDSRMTRI